MLADRLQIQEGAFGGIAFFLDDHLDACQLSLVGQHVDEGGMGNGDEVLVVDSANVHYLFPAFVVTYDDDSEPFGYHPVHNKPTGPMQIMVDLAVAFVGQGSEMVGGVLSRGRRACRSARSLL